MSTDMQRYSIENQAAAIGLYAAQNGLEIVRSYEDAGKSGLRIKGRSGLKQLITDVVSGNVNFSKVLVYDVSRWGRFQDNDESAHYEFLCRSSGVQVEYCAEQFANDGSVTASLLKNLKRAMAGEYSRELSVKVFAGQSRIAAQGFHMGSTPGYALQRCLVDQNGNRKRMLAPGERKSVHTEHTILVPGCPEQIGTVRRVYSLFIEGRQTLASIARMLNEEATPNVNGGIWYPHAVRQLLSNEKYIGVSIYNRTSKKLGAPYRFNKKSEWVRGVGAFEPLISREQFDAASSRLRTNASGHLESTLLDSLTALWCQYGRLNTSLIGAASDAPSLTTLRKRFGSIGEALRRVGYSGISNHTSNAGIRRDIRRSIVALVSGSGGTARSLLGGKYLLVNEEFTVAVGIGRTPPSSRKGSNRWLFTYHSPVKPDILIIARIDELTGSTKDYFILPFLFLPHGTWLSISGNTYKYLERFRSSSLAPLGQLCAREKVEYHESTQSIAGSSQRIP